MQSAECQMRNDNMRNLKTSAFATPNSAFLPKQPIFKKKPLRFRKGSNLFHSEIGIPTSEILSGYLPSYNIQRTTGLEPLDLLRIVGMVYGE